MNLFVALLALTATPESCESLWDRVWSAYAAKELPGRPPLFEKFPDARARLGVAWRAECRTFSAATFACARGEVREAELVALDRQLAKEGVSAAERQRALEAMRGRWSVLECREVERALDRAGAAVARQDAGVPASDDCAGPDLREGRCACAHARCDDQCCPAGWVCAHTGAERSKCLRPSRDAASP